MCVFVCVSECVCLVWNKEELLSICGLLLLRLQGCYELVTAFIESNMGIIAGVTFGIAFSQVHPLVLNCGFYLIQTSGGPAEPVLHFKEEQKEEAFEKGRHTYSLALARDWFHCLFSQLIGTSLACCLSRLINANQYEMVWKVMEHTSVHIACLLIPFCFFVFVIF